MKLDQSNRDENNNQIAPNIKLNKEELNLIQLIRTKTMFDGSSNLSYPKGIDAEYNIQDTSTYLKPRRADSAQDLTENHWVLTKKDTKDYVKYKQLKNTYRDLLIKRLQTSGRKAIELIKLHYQELERKNVSKNVIYEFFLDSRFGMIKKEAINELQNWKEQHLKESSQVFINGPQFIEEYVNTHINKFEFDEIEGIDTEEDIIDIKIEENTNDIE
ncbi:hypothetical protein K502DRAFT_61490 [Neoconidiobolus thromboides FSU 785]|nr:hypothetical protein K502DRAFT_61490 [Neoconidiobolus thromboides FSU 785]